MKRYLFLLILLLISIASLPALSADEIIQKMDEHQDFSSTIIKGSITRRDRFGELTSTYTAWAQGSDTFLLEFTSPAERGQKILRLDNQLYLFYPSAQELIRLQGSALRQSLIGSDLSYEDMSSHKNTLDVYDAKLLSSEIFNGRQCYVIELSSKKRNVAYPIQKMWVDATHYSLVKSEAFTASGRHLKSIEVEKTMMINNSVIAQKTLVIDQLKKNSSTTLEILSIEVDVPIEAHLFTLQNLRW
ncbi:MAG: outer membrane lipoprotein-sorting protein [Sphaerochaetaceae bacterium]|jgi:outer membrane lipoprotein-sorting protein